jgi:replicative DNA helicase
MVISTLIKRGVPKIDAELIITEADSHGVLAQVGGYEYVSSIMNMDVPEDNIDYYIEKVLNASTKHQLYVSLSKNMENLEESAGNEDVSSSDLLGVVANDVMTLSMQSKAVKEATNFAEGFDEFIAEKMQNPIEHYGMSTGFPILDRRIDGLVNGSLTVFCARPGEGKSTFLLNIGKYVAYTLQKPVLYVDTEMTFDQVRPRLISMMSGVLERRIKHGGYNDQELYNLQRAGELIKVGKYFHEFMPGYSVEKLVALYKKYKHVEDIGLAIFDYIKSPPGADFRNKKEYQLLGDVTTALHDLAGELDIPFICANQINRDDDVADSDRILRYTDNLMFFKPRTKDELDKIRPFERDYGYHKLVIRKARFGGTTTDEGIGYEFTKKILLITEASKQLVDYDSKEDKEKEELMYGDDSTESTSSISEQRENF